jgi:transcriptional regulator with XRE-family HTH domain
MTATVSEQIRSHLRVRRSLPTPAQRRLLRESAGLSQQALADLIGVSRQAVSHWETGLRDPAGAALIRYAEAIQALQEVVV